MTMNTITNFFKPVSKTSSSQASGSAPPQRQASQTPAPSSQLPPPPSSPAALALASPVAPVRRRDAVIRGSDEEDDDDSLSSDDDLPSLFARPKAAGGPVTPRAKRTAPNVFSSPLTMQPKHKFDFKALMKHAQDDNHLKASELRVESALSALSPTAEAKPRSTNAIATSEKRVSTSLHDNMLDVLSDADGSQNEGNREKLLRAVKRSEATAHRKEYFFFDDPAGQDPECASIRVRGSFPKSAATGPWKFLAAAKGRAELFEDGVPYRVQAKLKNIPDEIYLWVLAEIPIEPSLKLRGEYLRLLEVCPDQAGQLVNESLLVKMFQELGASERALGLAPRTSTTNSRCRGYNPQEIDWTSLVLVLDILSRTSNGLELDACTYAFILLLRLGMDTLIREDLIVQREYQDTLWWLVQRIHHDDWDQFCGEVCTSLYTHVDEYSLRWNAVQAIPLIDPRLVELRRRLSIVFIFNDPKRGLMSPEETFSVRAVNHRIDTDDMGTFTVDRQRSDYYELAALIGLLDIAIGDGNPPSRLGDNPAAAIEGYNDEVDQLIQRIKKMGSGIHDQGATSVNKVEVRMALKDFERKLEHATRTRPLPKADIFGIQARSAELDERQRPRQQGFMRKFLGQGIKKERSPSLPPMPRAGPASQSP